MGFIVFEEEAFNYLDAQLENFVKRMDRIRERSEDKTMNKIPVFMKEDLVPIIGDENMIQEIPEEFNKVLEAQRSWQK